MLREGIQSVDLNKIRSGAGDKKTSGVDAENALNTVYGTKYRINLDHPILTDHGVFYPQALPNDLVFELTLAPANEVVKGSDGSKLGYKLENIQIEYEVIRSKTLADEAMSTYSSGKEFAYDLVMREQGGFLSHEARTPRLNLRVNPQRRSLKGILLLCINPQAAGTLDTEHYFNPDITKVKVTVNGVPNRVYNEGISGSDMWKELTRYFNPSTNGRPNMTLTKYLTANKFGLWVDLRSMADTTMHGNGSTVGQYTGWRAARDRANSFRLGHHKLPHLHRLRLADEHHATSAGVGSVLGIRDVTNTHKYREAWTPENCHSTL